MKTSILILGTVLLLGVNVLSAEAKTLSGDSQLLQNQSENTEIIHLQMPSEPQADPIRIYVSLGQKFDISVEADWNKGEWWGYKTLMYGLDYYSKRVGWTHELLTFRVQSWLMGNELSLTMVRNDGLTQEYIICNNAK